MAVTIVVFDVGETLVDEATTYARWEAEGARRASRSRTRDLHADALPCLAALRARGLRLGAAGNMHARHEDFLRPHVDFVGSSERWGVEKPDGRLLRARRRRGGRAGRARSPTSATASTTTSCRRSPPG